MSSSTGIRLRTVLPMMGCHRIMGDEKTYINNRDEDDARVDRISGQGQAIRSLSRHGIDHQYALPDLGL